MLLADIVAVIIVPLVSREQPFNADGLSSVFMTFVLGTFSQSVTLDVFPLC